MHQAIFLEHILKRKLLIHEDKILFEKINQYIYSKFGTEKIKELCQKDLEREMNIRDKIKNKTFIYHGIDDLKQKVEKCLQTLNHSIN